MMRSMFSAVSGLRAHQTKMDVIANNIANVNTVGYKSSRATFSEIFSQTVSGASTANPVTGRAGTNPRQIGLGSSIASIDKVMTQGAVESTNRAYDLMIEGDSFFILGDASGTYFTRAGNMDFDESWNFYGAGGLKVMGWDAVDDPLNPGKQMIQKGIVKPIQLSGDKQYVTPKQTANIGFDGNINPQTDPDVKRSMTFFDSVGNSYMVDVNFNYTPATGWKYTIGTQATSTSDSKTVIPLTIAGTSGPTGPITFDNNGMISLSPPNLTIKVSAQSGAPLSPSSSLASGIDLNLDLKNLTQFVNEVTNVKPDTLDGNAPGQLNGISIGTDGKMTGRYSNGQTKVLAQIAVANFRNPGGLEKVGDNLFVVTANSGEFDGVGEEVQSGGGKMRSGALEMSNVDLSAEFTQMITTQRGFQANSRVITTSDDMLQELVNLKR